MHIIIENFSDECRVTLNEPEGMSRSWDSHISSQPIWLRNQQVGFFGIIGSKIKSSFKVNNGIKLKCLVQQLIIIQLNLFEQDIFWVVQGYNKEALSSRVFLYEIMHFHILQS